MFSASRKRQIQADYSKLLNELIISTPYSCVAAVMAEEKCVCV